MFHGGKGRGYHSSPVFKMDMGGVMIVDRKQHRGCQRRLFWIEMLFATILWVGTLVACGDQSGRDRSLTTNEAVIDNATPTAAVVARSKTIKPIEVVANQSSLTSYANGKMNLTIISSPYAICNFIVSYGMSTPSRSFGIKPTTVDAQGRARWQWQVEGKAPTGRWPLTITATLANGAQTSRTIDVTVKLPPINLDSTKSRLKVSRKAEATLAVVTAPLVSCTMTMSYTSRNKIFKGIADSKGEISWAWNVEAGANPGIYPLTVTVTTISGEQERAIFDIAIE
jgi:hypothetical protein